jgi:hypothetical protein
LSVIRCLSLLLGACLCGAKAVRKALLWDIVAGCFSACVDDESLLCSKEEESRYAARSETVTT